ncbi:transposase domain-containing protein [Nonomuraea sp. NPDC059194]|uniref:transposase domain-containing protein n=1 Tax=Nonomuraea sp. NPDC059194 TaxID=3346764 RepID=UPI0036B8E1A8
MEQSAMSVAGRVFVPAHVGALTDQLASELVDEVLASTARRERRVHLLPARVMVFFVLAMTLFPERGYGGVWAAVCSALRSVINAVPSASGLRQARARLGSAPLRELFERMRGPVAPAGLRGAWWRAMLSPP